MKLTKCRSKSTHSYAFYAFLCHFWTQTATWWQNHTILTSSFKEILKAMIDTVFMEPSLGGSEFFDKGGRFLQRHVTCHLSHVTCHMSRVTCHVSKWTKWWSLSVEGLLSTGPTPSSLSLFTPFSKTLHF